MKLLRLKADGFGVLRGEYAFAPDRLNLVVDFNERGKTSLLHAIVAGLYGLDGDGRRYRSLLTPLERWRPWDGGRYGVELEVESEGERYTIVRDFGRGTTQVWNERGQDVTADFLTERDDFSVGQQLLGLDADEFAKCAFWRQGELADVVPDQERDRRTSGLQARLESAADTRSGDASAIEAIQVLDGALARYTSLELGTTITTENAIKRLVALRESLLVDIQSLEHDQRSIAGSLGEIARLAEDERALSDRIAAFDAHRLQLRTQDAERRLARDAEIRAEIDWLRAEAAGLEAFATVPHDAEASLSAHAARHDEVRRRNAARTRDRDAAAGELAGLDRALAALETVAGRGAEDADRLAVRAGELRRMAEERARRQADLEAALDSMRARGHDPDRAARLLPRFAELGADRAALLRDQPLATLGHRTALAAAEQAAIVGHATLEEIGAWRQPRWSAGGLLLALGLAAASVVVAGWVPGATVAVLAAGGALAAIGGALLVIATVGRRADERQARERIAVATEQTQRAQLAVAENATRLAVLAEDLEYEDPGTLVADWDEALRLRDLYTPIQAAEQQLDALERQHAELVDDAHALLSRAGGGEPSPERLDEATSRIRRRLDLESRRAAHAAALDRIDAELEASEAMAAEIERVAAEALAAAGLEHESNTAWADWIAAIGERARQAVRRRAILDSQLPALERELLDDATRAALIADIEHAAQAGMGLSASDRADAAAIPTAAETEARVVEMRTRLEALRTQRASIDRSIHAAAERYHAEHPGRCARLAIVERDFKRAERFRDAITLARSTIERVARETHRRWADFLNDRVTELLREVGANVSRVRFGEDLDFAITMSRGPQTARAKALHQLSAGARDQLHLAVRLAISEFLSRGGERLPLLVDDCFATSDDERTRSGMRLLLETFSREHQLVLVTCHRGRYEALEALDSELFADRVRWIELRPAETPV